MLNRAGFIDEVQNRVAKAFALSRAELLSRSRKREVASARQIAMYLCRDLAKSAAYGASSMGWRHFRGSEWHFCEIIRALFTHAMWYRSDGRLTVALPSYWTS